MARGYLTLAVVGGFVLVADLAGRLLIAPAMALFPRSRARILTAWMRGIARALLGLVIRLGGVRLAADARIPGREGVLVVGNHQSVLDIPLVVHALADCHPRIVTRGRYGRRIPMVSHLLALSRSPLVDADRPAREQVAELAEVARTTGEPLVIFPEGHRSRDGALRPFRRGGLGAILGARPWSVYLHVVDGFWQAGKLKELARALSGIRGRAVSCGPFEWPGTEAGGDVDSFMTMLESRLGEELARLREGRPA